MDLKLVIVIVLFGTTTVAPQEYTVKPSPPENLLFQLTSQVSFVISWTPPPGMIDYYLLDYYPDGQTSVKVAINSTETFHEEVNEGLDPNTLGINIFTVFDDVLSEPAGITVLDEHDKRLPPAIVTATRKWTSQSSIQLQWALPLHGDYDGLLLLYAPQNDEVEAMTVQIDATATAYKVTNVSRDKQYIIHLYTVKNGIHSEPAILQSLPDNVHACEGVPCKNGAICREYETDPNMYACECNPGFDGTMCENNIDECDPNPCQNGGLCMDGDNTFSCVCDSSYEGITCQTPGGAGVAVRASVMMVAVGYALYGILLRSI